MRGFWQRWRDPLGLYARLEARRAHARPEFVRRLSEEVGGSRRRSAAPLRIALVGALTLVMLAAAGTVGAAGYASSAVAKVAQAVTPDREGGQYSLADEDDDDDGGRGDDDDDGGGGGGGGNDDDDDGDDPDDDQYEEEQEECEDAVRQSHEDFHDLQKSEHRLFHGQGGGHSAHRLLHRQQQASHRAQHELMRAALDECDAIGGGGDDDDDD